MPFIGNKPASVPLTSADITDGIIVNADINASAAIAKTKLNLAGTIGISDLSATGTASSSTFLRGDNTWNTPAAGAFVFLAETSASNVSSVSLNGYFSSTYDVYKVFIDGVYGSSTAYSAITFNTTGSYTEQTSNYYFYFGPYLNSSNTGVVVFDSSYDSVARMPYLYLSTTQAQAGVAELTIHNPQSTTYWKYITGNVSHYGNSFAQGGVFSGGWRDATAITGINFKMTSGNLYARKIRLYGVKNS